MAQGTDYIAMGHEILPKDITNEMIEGMKAEVVRISKLKVLNLTYFGFLMKLIQRNNAFNSFLYYYTLSHAYDFNECRTCFALDKICSKDCEVVLFKKFHQVFVEQFPLYWTWAEMLFRRASRYFQDQGKGKWHEKYTRAFQRYQKLLKEILGTSITIHHDYETIDGNDYLQPNRVITYGNL